MSFILSERVKGWAQKELLCTPLESEVVVDNVRHYASTAGYGLDESFADAGMSAGPDGRIASRLVDRALGRSGNETGDGEISTAVSKWLMLSPKGKRGGKKR